MVENKPTKAPEKFIRLLKNAMDAHPGGLSLTRIAKQADISPAYLSLLLNGERGVPSNEAITQLEGVLNIPKGELFNAAGRPDDQALEFFRKDEAGSIMRKLGSLPHGQLAKVDRMLGRLVKGQNRAKVK